MRPLQKNFIAFKSAKKWELLTKKEIADGRLDLISRSMSHTFADAAINYIDGILPSTGFTPKYIRQFKSQSNYWIDCIGSVTLDQVTPELIGSERDKLARIKSTATANRYLATLSKILSVAKKELRWLPQNPMEYISYLGEGEGRTRYLTREEVRLLLDACRSVDQVLLYPIVLVALSCGPRKSEILNLKVDDIDLARSTAVLRRTKNKTQRQIYLHGQALVEIKKRVSCSQSKNKQYIFSGKYQDEPIDVDPRWRRALKLSGIKAFRFHDLRHTAASYLAINGASTLEIAEILGHKKLDMVKRYAHLSATRTSETVQKMNKDLFLS